jgi:hypothetical protein
MHKFFLGKLGADHKKLNEVISSESLLFESKFVFFATTSGPEGGSGSGDDEKEDSQKEQQQNTEDMKASAEANEASKKASEQAESQASITNLREGFSSRYMDVLDKVERNLPVDIDPSIIPDAKEEISEIKSQVDTLYAGIENDVKEFTNSAELEEGKAQVISKILYGEIPRYTEKDLKNGGSQMKKQLSFVKIASKIKHKLGEDIDSNILSKFIKKILPKMKEMAEYEFAMIKKIEEVYKVVWEVGNSLQNKEIKARKIKSAETYLGFSLTKGQELECLGLRRVTNPETGVKEFREFPQKWTIRDIKIDNTRRANPEDPDNPEAIVAGLWISLTNSRGEVERFSPSRMKRFVDTHDLKPTVRNKEKLIENVPHLHDMGFEMKEGMTLEYDIFQQDASGEMAPNTQEVKIISIDNSKVVLDRKILYRAQASSPDLATDEEKSTLTLGEFAKWLNQKNVIPQMNVEEFNNAIYRHYNYMNKKYKSRRETCHAPISIKEGAVLYSNTPDMPLYRVEGVSEDGLIKLTNKKPMTFVQFIKWIHANDMEPYTPELEENKSKEYSNLSDKKAAKVGEDTGEIIKYFESHPGEYRRTREAWMNSLKGQESHENVGTKEEHYNTPIGPGPQNYLLDFWKGTSFLRIDDFIEIFKISYEFWTKSYELTQRHRYTGVAQGLPYFGDEFKRREGAVEKEGLEYYKDNMSNYTTWDVENVLYSTGNPDELLACLFILSEGGLLRFDDPNVWGALNKINDHAHQIPLIALGADPYTPFGPGHKKFAGQTIEGMTGMDLFEKAIDSFFGPSMYMNLKRGNDSGISEGKSKATTKAQELESDPKNRGGLDKELERLLTNHAAGEFVDPSEFEGLLWYAFESQGIGADARIYFLLMSLFTKNKRGRTLLSWERLGAFITQFNSPTFPAMDFFKGGDRRDLETGEFIEGGAITHSDLAPIVNKWIANAKGTDPPNYESAGKDVNKFFLEEILTSDPFQKRLEKAIGEGNMDHEDVPYFIPALKESAIGDVLGNAGGNRKKFSITGYKNTYLGFGWRLGALVNKIDKESIYAKDGKDQFLKDYKGKLANTFRTFVRYDGIISNRYLVSKGDTVQRLEKSDMDSGSAYSPTPIREYQEEMHGLLNGIIDAYLRSNKINAGAAANLKLALEKPTKKTGSQIETAIKNFSVNFDAMIGKDDGGILFNTVKSHGSFISEANLNISSAEKKANESRIEVAESSSVEPAEPAGGDDLDVAAA